MPISQKATFVLEFQDADTIPSKPLPAARVRVQALDAAGRPAVTLFDGRANAEGKVILRVLLPATVPGQPTTPLPKVRVTVLDLDGDTLHQVQPDIQPERGKAIPPIQVSDKPQQEKLAMPLGDGNGILGRPLSTTLAKKLKQQKIVSLATLREAGPQAITGLSTQDQQDLVHLAAHAQLQLISRSHANNQKLIAAGYPDALAVAREPQDVFVKKMVASGLNKDNALRLHVGALKTKGILSNMQTEVAASKAERRNSPLLASTTGGVAEPEPPCHDCGCDSALSPQAYLVDLLDHAVRHVRQNGNVVTSEILTETFLQPFGDLVVGCAASANPVRQVRLCVEVLRQRAHTLGLTTSQPVFHATVDYNARAYNIILRELGTSYRELRSARTGDQSVLAERLGVDQTAIPAIILDPDVLGSRQLSQLNLERLFGLQTERVDQRDPISTGYKFGDDRNQIIHWQLDGVEWRRNTDDLGQIHLGLTGASATNFQITLFKSQSRDETSQVAAGKYIEAGKPIQLSPLNGSGLSGYVQVNFVGADDNIYFAPIPEWTAKRLQNLRGQWIDADYPKSEFAAPIVDPDVVDESDFARPFGVDPATDPNLAHKLWIERRNWVKTERTKLDEDATATPPKLTIAKMRERVWPNPADLADLDALAEDLRGSDAAKVNAAHATLKARGLTPETIGFLHELVSHEDQKAPTDVERAQALDVLVNILKRRDKYSIWRTEEQTIKLAPPFFCLSTVEPALNPLRATADERASWRAELEKNSTPPIIDPDLIPETFLAANSETIQTLWNSRRALIGDGRGRRPDDPARVSGTMFDAIAADINNVQSLKRRLMDTDLSSNAIVNLHSFGFQDADLDNMQQALRDGKPLEVNAAQYGLTASELRLLIEVLNLGVDADASDWSNVHHILVQAEKRRHQYPLWRAEEQAAGLSLGPDHFRIPADLFADLLTVFRRVPAFLQWRWNEGSQRGTLEKLKTRLQQQRDVIENIRAAVDKAEEECLPVLRDALVGVIVGALIDSGQITKIGSNSTLEDRKRWVTNWYLIDAFESGCRQTTRVAQAIETLQLLLWGIRSGQVEDKTLTLAPDQYAESTDPAFDFDAEWKWLGSYASWRSAMFMYLYPENLLLPELRRAVDDPDTDPTILFQAILKVVSGTASSSSSIKAEETKSDTPPPPPENPELQAKIDGILEAIGDADPQSDASLKMVFRCLHYWRLGDGAVVETQQDDAASPFYYYADLPGEVTVQVWWKYINKSSFLEDALYVPLQFALLQQRLGNFTAALDWFRRVYDFERKPEPPKQSWANPRLGVYFARYGGNEIGYSDLDLWDDHNLNPHRIAATRPGVDQRFVLISIIRCLLDYADGEFAKDTSESLARARELYETTRRLLDSNALGKVGQDCQAVIGTLVSEIGETRRIPYTVAVLEDLFGRNPAGIDLSREGGNQLLADLKKATLPGTAPKPDAQIRKDIVAVVEHHLSPRAVETVEQRRKAGITAQEAAFKTLLDQPQVFKRVQRVDSRSGRPTMAFGAVLAVEGPAQFVADRGRWVEAPNFAFCIPRNPLLQMLRLRLESNWFKLHHCMNLAGLYRELPAYAAPTDTSSGLVVAEVSSPTALSAGNRQMPTQYRYRVLIERARQLVNIAQQMEASLPVLPGEARPGSLQPHEGSPGSRPDSCHGRSAGAAGDRGRSWKSCCSLADEHGFEEI